MNTASLRVLAVLACGLLFADAVAAQAGSLPVSKGRYRLPYANGTTVRANNDHTNHPAALNRIDLGGRNGSNYVIVAAADGWLRIIEDDNTLWCPNADPGDPDPCEGVANCCERDDVSCNADCKNNFVWIEHPNGEWTKYSHMRTGSVADNGHMQDDFVQAGEALGIEGRVGLAGGNHLHFEVAVPNDGLNSFTDDGFLVGDGDPTTNDYNRQNRVPAFCVGPDGPIWTDGDQFVSANCSNACVANSAPSDVIGAGEAVHRQATLIAPTAAHRIATGGGEALSAITRITLQPGFRVDENGYFSATIAPCNSPGSG
jgi:murein DD-endopeptidase MepM/ murein hydrolase activator NlpD